MKPIALFFVLGGLLYLHAHFDASRHSQRVTGGDALSVAFGDAKTQISRAMVAKADLYFHGGVGHKCGEEGEGEGGGDPWQWINERIAAPDVHEHLEGEKSVELLPWLWASVKSDPHNEDAWDSAWYTAAHMMKDDKVATEILNEGLKVNPNSARLYLTKGQFLYKMGKGEGEGGVEGKRWAEAEACFEKAVALSQKDSQIREFATRYLADIHKKREDRR